MAVLCFFSSSLCPSLPLAAPPFASPVLLSVSFSRTFIDTPRPFCVLCSPQRARPVLACVANLRLGHSRSCPRGPNLLCFPRSTPIHLLFFFPTARERRKRQLVCHPTRKIEKSERQERKGRKKKAVSKSAAWRGTRISP